MQAGVILLILVIGSISGVILECPSGEMLVFNSVTDKPLCEKCPKNCHYCYKLGDKKLCARCPEGFYLDSDKQCQKCTDNCTSCSGPGFEKCSQLEEGYLIDLDTKTSLKCPDGCRECNSEKECVNCLPGYLENSKLNEKQKPILKHGIPVVTCSRCNEMNCNFCFINKTGFEECLICKESFGFNRRLNSCHKCKVADCEECTNDYRMCSRCKDDYLVSLADGSCHKMPAHCQHIDPFSNGKCMTCKIGYTLAVSDGICVPCSAANALCTSCGFTKVKNTLVCRACADGHYWSTKYKDCMKCSDNCIQCSTPNNCRVCQFGFQLENGTCIVQKDSNCRIVDEKGKCFECESNHFYNEKENKCLPCFTSCNSCTGPQSKHCQSCFVDRLALFGGTPKTSSLISCVENCPVEQAGKKIVPDYFTMRCIENGKAEEQKPTEKYSFRRTQKIGKVTKETLAFDVKQFNLELTKYIQESTKSFKEWAVKNPYMKNEFSEQCNYRGKLVQSISISREAHLVCKCSSSYHELTCSIEPALYDQIQKFARSILNDLNALKPSGQDQEISEIFINLAAGSLSESTLAEMVQSISGLVNNGNQICGNIPLIMKMFDAVITANYNYGYEIENSLDTATDIDSAKFKEKLYRRLHKIMDLQKETAKNCFTSGQINDITLTSTTSFQSVLKAYELGMFIQNQKNSVGVPPPNILGTSSTTRPIMINYISSELEAVDPNPFLVYPIVYSSILFDQITTYDYTISSYMVAPNILCAQTKTEDYDCSKALTAKRSLNIRFPLRHVLASNGEITEKLNCMKVSYSDTELKPKAMSEKPVDKFYTEGIKKELIAECIFNDVNEDELDHTFYTVGFKSDSMPKPQHKSDIEKIWEETDENSKVQLPVYPRKFEIKSSSLYMMSLGLTLIMACLH